MHAGAELAPTRSMHACGAACSCDAYIRLRVAAMGRSYKNAHCNAPPQLDPWPAVHP